VKDDNHDGKKNLEKSTSLFWYLPFVEFILSPYIYRAVSFICMGFLDCLLMYARVLVRLGICHFPAPKLWRGPVHRHCLFPGPLLPSYTWWILRISPIEIRHLVRRKWRATGPSLRSHRSLRSSIVSRETSYPLAATLSSLSIYPCLVCFIVSSSALIYIHAFILF
jgi:hypothetical protein